MSLIQELGREQIENCLTEAVCRGVPVSMTCHIGNTWHNLHTRILKRSGQRLWLEHPTCNGEPAEDGPDMAKGLMLGLAFKLGHHKHIFNTLVETTCRLRLEGSETVHAVCVSDPLRMQRIQRRAYQRADVPRSRSVLATFWPGGQDSDQSIRWEGWVTNISAGGFQVRLASRAGPHLNAGDIAGVRIDVGEEYEPILADAQYRHEACPPTYSDKDGRQVSDPPPADGVVLLGFQFIGLNESARGRRTLGRISRIVRGFQRLQGRRRAGGAA